MKEPLLNKPRVLWANPAGRNRGPAGSPAHLDAGVLASLRELAPGPEGATLLASLAGLFLDDAPKQLRAARAAAAAGEAAGLRIAMHTLKSSAGNMGALHLFELARALERDAHDALPAERAGAAR